MVPVVVRAARYVLSSAAPSKRDHCSVGTPPPPAFPIPMASRSSPAPPARRPTTRGAGGYRTSRAGHLGHRPPRGDEFDDALVKLVRERLGGGADARTDASASLISPLGGGSNPPPATSCCICEARKCLVCRCPRFTSSQPAERTVATKDMGLHGAGIVQSHRRWPCLS